MNQQLHAPIDTIRNVLFTLTLALFLAACGTTPQAVAPSAAQQPTAMPVAPQPTPPLPEGSVARETSPCTALLNGTAGAPAAVEPPAPLAGGLVRYDGESKTIIIANGATTTLAGVSQALGKAELLSETAPGQWLLGADLRIEAGASLTIAAPEVRWLKLRSDGAGFAALRAIGGTLQIEGACVSSWDPASNTFDEQTVDGRSYVLARDGARMEIRRAELRNLGYGDNESYGLAWRLAGTSGAIIDSYLAYNWYGLYSYEVNDLVIRGNEVHHNIMYGLDPHTRSNRLQIESNVVHNNGKHGIVLAEECSDSVIRNNIVYNNLHHGIVIYQRSNNNLVEGNSSYGNGEQGININDSTSTVVRNNVVFDNIEAGIGVGQGATGTEVVGNSVRANRKDGISVYSAANESALRENVVQGNGRYGINIKSDGPTTIEGNQVSGNAVDLQTNEGTPGL